MKSRPQAARCSTDLPMTAAPSVSIERASDVDATAPADGLHRDGLVVGVLWSLSAAFFAAGFLIPYRFAVEAAPRTSAMTAMFLSAAIFNAAVAAFQTDRWRLDRVAIRTAVVLAILTIVSNLAIALALVEIGTGMTSVVLKSQVVLTPILAVWLLSERMSPRFWVGAVLALLGVGLPAAIESAAYAEAASRGPSGYGWAFAAATGFAGMQIVTTRVIMKIQPAFVNALRLAMVVVALQALPGGRNAWTMDAWTWVMAAAAGFLGPGLSRLSLMHAVRYVSPSVAALVALVGPIFAFALGGFFFDEVPTTWDLAGAALILAGIVWPFLPRLVRSARASLYR